jgi:hypothetical protein
MNKDKDLLPRTTSGEFLESEVRIYRFRRECDLDNELIHTSDCKHREFCGRTKTESAKKRKSPKKDRTTIHSKKRDSS